MIVKLNTGQIRSGLGVFVLDSDDEEVLIVNCSDETTALTTGLKITFRMPFGMNDISFRACLTTAQTAGSIVTANITKSGTTIFSTQLSIDNNSSTSVGATTPYALSTSTLEDNTEISILITQVGTSPTGLKIYFYGTTN